MLDKLFRAHSEKNGGAAKNGGLGEKNGGAAMNGTASTKENPGVRRELSERPTPDMLRRTDSMTAFHAQKEFQDRTVSIGNDEREYFVSGCLLLLDCARGDLERVHAVVKDSPTLVNFWDYDRRTPLHVASSEGRADVVKYLLAHDARPNRSDRWGGSPYDRGRRRGCGSHCPGRFRSKRPHDEVEESAAGFYPVAQARREEAAVSCSNAELLPAPGGRQSCAARPAAVHGQLQVYHLLSSESYLPPLPCSNVSYFIR